MYNVLIVEPQESSLNALLSLPIWKEEKDGRDGFVCRMTASNGQEALDLIREYSFDLILTEMNLPICDGLQLLKKVHKTNLPPLIVFVSEMVTFAYAREGFIYGAFDYLPKPVSKYDMEELFARAADELEKMKRRPHGASDHPRYRVSSDQLNKLAAGFCRRNQNVLQNFHDILRALYESPKAPGHNPDLMASKLYSSLIDEIYARNEWLELYLPSDFHKQIDYLEPYSSDHYISFYMRKLTHLFEQYCLLNPEFQDETITKIHTYILLHPEDDLRLTTIAGRFYMNHTYLSTLYSRKSSTRYSRLVTLIKMKRAECLINFTTDPLPDIACHLGYKDFHYFLKLFKDTIGRAASDYIRSETDDLNYSI